MKRASISTIRDQIQLSIVATRRQIQFLEPSRDNPQVATIVLAYEEREQTLKAVLDALNGNMVNLKLMQEYQLDLS